jgi:CheY-like chemotaxis protein
LGIEVQFSPHYGGWQLVGFMVPPEVFKILVVDDSAVIRTLIRKKLQQAGFVVVEAGDGVEALDRITDDVAVIVSDITMPGMNGLEMVERIRRTRPNLPVILITGHTELESKLHGFRLLRKPFDLGDLLREVQGAVAREV